MISRQSFYRKRAFVSLQNFFDWSTRGQRSWRTRRKWTRSEILPPKFSDFFPTSVRSFRWMRFLMIGERNVIIIASRTAVWHHPLLFTSAKKVWWNLENYLPWIYFAFRVERPSILLYVLSRWRSLTIQLTCLIGLDSAALLLFNQQQIYFFNQIHTSQTGGQTYIDTSLHSKWVFSGFSFMANYVVNLKANYLTKDLT